MVTRSLTAAVLVINAGIVFVVSAFICCVILEEPVMVEIGVVTGVAIGVVIIGIVDGDFLVVSVIAGDSNFAVKNVSASAVAAVSVVVAGDVVIFPSFTDVVGFSVLIISSFTSVISGAVSEECFVVEINVIIAILTTCAFAVF